jgi:hypothetical protein
MPNVIDQTTQEHVEEQDTLEVEGEKVDLDDLKFVQLHGTELSVYLPKQFKTFKNPEGEDMAIQVGGGTIEFRHGIYPPGDETITYANAKMLTEHKHYGDLFKVARSAFDVPTAEEVREAREEQMDEDEVFIDGQVMKKSEALDYLQSQGEEDEEKVDEAAPSEFDGEEAEPEGNVIQSLTEIDAANKQDALEKLASHGVDMEGAPSASDNTEAIQAFAMNNGFVIPKYDLPDTA